MSELQSKSHTKPLYILSVSDPDIKAKVRTFACINIDKDAMAYVTIKGYELTGKKTIQLRSIEQAQELATSENLEMMEIIFPWHCVKSLRNASYKGIKGENK